MSGGATAFPSLELAATPSRCAVSAARFSRAISGDARSNPSLERLSAAAPFHSPVGSSRHLLVELPGSNWPAFLFQSGSDKIVRPNALCVNSIRSVVRNSMKREVMQESCRG
jgi:hypothetical protein